MPHLVKMDRKYRAKGLVLIGEEVQGTSEDKIKAFAKEHDVEFPVTKGTKRPASLRGIPFMLVFDAKGENVFAGHPGSDECERAIKTALKIATPPEGAGASDGDDFFARRELVPMRSWTNKDGNSLEATLVSLEGTTGTFRKSNGQTFSYDIGNLSAEDQAIIPGAAQVTDDELE